MCRLGAALGRGGARRVLFICSLPLLSLFAAGSPLAAAVAVAATWVLGSDTATANETADAWVLLPAALASDVRVEILPPVGLEAWVRGENETCQHARRRLSRIWVGAIVGDQVVPVCLRATRPQKLRLLARLRLGPGADAVRVIASNALEVKPLIGYGPALIAVFSALLGFLASVFTAWLARRGERKSTVQKAETEIQTVLTRELAAEVVRNSLQLRGWLENPGSAPQDLKTWGGDLLFNPSRGALAYLSKPGRLGFLRKFTVVYRQFNRYNRAVEMRQTDEAHAAASAALELLDSSPELTTARSSTGGSP
jgi:hypothetical protein